MGEGFLVHPLQQFVTLWLSGTVIHSWVSRLHVLPLQSYCFTGAVNGKNEFTTKGVFHSFPISPHPTNPFQSFSIRLPDKMCDVATNSIRDLTADGQRLTRSDSQRLGLSKLFTVHICRECKLLVMNEILQIWINMLTSPLLPSPPSTGGLLRTSLPEASQSGTAAALLRTRRRYRRWWRQRRRSPDQPNHLSRNCTRPPAAREPPPSSRTPPTQHTNCSPSYLLAGASAACGTGLPDLATAFPHRTSDSFTPSRTFREVSNYALHMHYNLSAQLKYIYLHAAIRHFCTYVILHLYGVHYNKNKT